MDECPEDDDEEEDEEDEEDEDDECDEELEVFPGLPEARPNAKRSTKQTIFIVSFQQTWGVVKIQQIFQRL